MLNRTYKIGRLFMAAVSLTILSVFIGCSQEQGTTPTANNLDRPAMVSEYHGNGGTAPGGDSDASIEDRLDMSQGEIIEISYASGRIGIPGGIITANADNKSYSIEFSQGALMQQFDIGWQVVAGSNSEGASLTYFSLSPSNLSFYSNVTLYLPNPYTNQVKYLIYRYDFGKEEWKHYAAFASENFGYIVNVQLEMLGTYAILVEPLKTDFDNAL